MSVLSSLAEAFPSVEFDEVLDGQNVANVPVDDYIAFVGAAYDAGFDVFVDLCGVDYLRREPRFEVVLNVLSYSEPMRLRIRVGVSGTEPIVPSVTGTYPGANFYEREAFDLYGIVFTDHPDLTRIVLPDEWEGHPLRKDYSVGSVPVRFKESPKPQ